MWSLIESVDKSAKAASLSRNLEVKNLRGNSMTNQLKKRQKIVPLLTESIRVAIAPEVFVTFPRLKKLKVECEVSKTLSVD